MKAFDEWNSVKKRLQAIQSTPYFNEREIWWVSVGANLGVKIMGKGAQFRRPVLVLDKHNNQGFFGLPLGSTRKTSRHLFPLYFHDREGSVLLSQGRSYSSKRLIHIIGTLAQRKFQEIAQAYRAQFNK